MKVFFKRQILINIILFVVVIFVGVRAVRMVWDAVVLYRESQSVEEQIEELTRKKQELEAYLAEIETPEAVRREAKGRLNLKNPGEQVVVVLPEDTTPKKHEQTESFWSRIRGFFFK